MKRQLSLVVVLLAVVGLAAVTLIGSAAAQTGKGKTPAKGAAKGGGGVDAAPIYKQHCAKCHAADGKGIPSLEPPDLTSAEWQAKATDKEITEAINEGKGIMPGFKETLKPAQVNALVKYVRAMGPKK